MTDGAKIKRSEKVREHFVSFPTPVKFSSPTCLSFLHKAVMLLVGKLLLRKLYEFQQQTPAIKYILYIIFLLKYNEQRNALI